MQIRERLKEDNAVSPVIGVILMVAITVILAAVIASFVLGLGPDTNTTPSATFESSLDNTDELTITMTNGQSIDTQYLYLRGDLDNGNTAWDSADGGDTSVEEVSAGTEIMVVVDDETDYEVRLVYEDGDTSSTLQTFED